MRMTFALMIAAVGIGSVHTLAPDHWVPFAALARAERWSTWRTAAVTAVCGIGHVTVSVLLGLVSAFFGLELLESFGRHLESVAGFLLIGFGVTYALWGIHRSVQGRWHHHAGHGHPHWHRGHHGHGHADEHDHRMTAWGLFLLFSADPCVAVIPLLFAAAPAGWRSVVPVVAAYELATIGTMVALALPARAVTQSVTGHWMDRYSEAIAGGVIALVGAAVMRLGL